MRQKNRTKCAFRGCEHQATMLLWAAYDLGIIAWPDLCSTHYEQLLREVKKHENKEHKEEC